MSHLHYETSYESTNAQKFRAAVDRACAESLKSDARGCTIHVNAVVEMRNGAPLISCYRVSDWCDGSTVASVCNGRIRD